MNAKVDKFKSGWIGISLAFGDEEIEVLIRRLEALKAKEIAHFHLRNNDFSRNAGIADVEISMRGDAEADNLWIE